MCHLGGADCLHLCLGFSVRVTPLRTEPQEEEETCKTGWSVRTAPGTNNLLSLEDKGTDPEVTFVQFKSNPLLWADKSPDQLKWSCGLSHHPPLDLETLSD